MASRTKAEVFIIESLASEKEWVTIGEGEILLRLLRMMKKRARHHYVCDREELQATLDLFEASKCRYLHLSCHGNDKELALESENIAWSELARLIGHRLQGKRLFLSVCEGGAIKLAEPLIEEFQCNSVCGPEEAIAFSDAALLWGSFYNEMFKRDENRMLQKPISRCLATLSYVYNVPLRLFLRSGANKMISKPITPSLAEALLARLDEQLPDP